MVRNLRAQYMCDVLEIWQKSRGASRIRLMRWSSHDTVFLARAIHAEACELISKLQLLSRQDDHGGPGEQYPVLPSAANGRFFRSLLDFQQEPAPFGIPR
jgi:hypothetical protein